MPVRASRKAARSSGLFISAGGCGDAKNEMVDSDVPLGEVATSLIVLSARPGNIHFVSPEFTEVLSGKIQEYFVSAGFPAESALRL